MANLATGLATAKRIDDINTGYDQSQRWSFNPSRDGKTFVANREGDCSSVCLAILKAMEPELNMTDPAYTGTFRAKAAAVGATAIGVRGKTVAQLRALLQPGDFLLNSTNHVEFWTGSQLFSASIDERGKISGGQAGDQTGREVRYTGLYVYSRGWDYIIRPKYTAATTSGKSVATLAAEVIAGKYGTGEARKKALGAQYAAVQAEVNRILAAKPAPAKKSNETIAAEVWAGKWGNGEARTAALKKAGYNPATIQALVNKGVGKPAPAKKTNEQIAREVIAGKWGNGEARRKNLAAAGYNYSAVQAIVNRLV